MLRHWLPTLSLDDIIPQQEAVDIGPQENVDLTWSGEIWVCQLWVGKVPPGVPQYRYWRNRLGDLGQNVGFYGETFGGFKTRP